MLKLAEHVVRQFMVDSNAIENIGGATDREVECLKHFLELPKLSVVDVADFVNVCGGAPLRLRPDQNVQVGAHIAPRGGPKIGQALEFLLSKSPLFPPMQVHDQFMWLHPFMDGNGRAGRALWLRCLLDSPDKLMIGRYGLLRTMYYLNLTRNDPASEAQWRKQGWDFS